ncbi:hypothetical protein PsYK624_073270 [Phanerochaete sordida]|uniref:Uncharacterized protein n=1 Tax=Phanerochaete sordida TaxID=48140 RepID=A0A9P3GA78_9APHY|nr:hypothetical protein PsYK624_073270 [Phanerochaete sordida]
MHRGCSACNRAGLFVPPACTILKLPRLPPASRAPDTAAPYVTAPSRPACARPARQVASPARTPACA